LDDDDLGWTMMTINDDNDDEADREFVQSTFWRMMNLKMYLVMLGE
jgi:hypothetical protein